MFTFNTSGYKSMHGRAPKGYGLWWFEINGARTTQQGTYGVAKKRIVQRLKGQGIKNASIKVCP
jgi:hypothetical protein